MSHSWGNRDGMGALGKTAALSNQRQAYPPFSGSHFASVGNVGTSQKGNRLNEAVAHLANFFGEPNNDVSRIGRYDPEGDLYEQENNDYPEAFKRAWGGTTEEGIRNGHLSRVMLEKAKASQSYQITRMAPWREHSTGGLEFGWDVTRQHMLDREPEESVPRLLTNTRTSGSTTMVRYGIALLLESNFAATPLGRQVYLLNIEQIRIATMETASYGAMISILEHTPYEDLFERHFAEDSQMSRQAIDRRFKEETAMWGVVHKERSGYDTVRRKLTKVLQDRNGGNGGDFTVIPCGMQQFMRETTEAKYYLDGAAGKRRNLNLFGQVVVESRGFSQGDHSLPHDPCFRHQTIGGFQTLHDHLLSSMDVKDYRTDYLDSYGYDEDKDEFHRFRYKNLYQYSGVWNFREPHAPLTDKIGKGFAYDMHCYTWGQALKKSTDFNRVVDKIDMLSPEKRIEFAGSLRTLDANDPRVTIDGEDFPTYRAFKHRDFDAMMEGDILYDTTFGISQRQHFEAKRKRGESFAQDNDYHKFEKWRQRQERRQGAAPLVPPTLQDLVNDGEEMDLGDSHLPRDFALHPARSQQIGDLVAEFDDQQPRRIVRIKHPRREDKTPSQEDQEVIKKLSESIRDQKWTHDDELGPVAIKSRDDEIGNFIDAIIKKPMFSDTAKIAVLSEVLRVFKSESQDEKRTVGVHGILSEGVFVGGISIQSIILCYISPFIARSNLELRAALDSLPQHKTELEQAILDDDDILKHRAESVYEEGWFQLMCNAEPPDKIKPEDGHLYLDAIGHFLSGINNIDTHALPILHDAHAITLSADNLVLFSLPKNVSAFLQGANFAPSTHFVRSAHRSRTNLFIWNLALSVLHLKLGTRLKNPTIRAEYEVIAPLLEEFMHDMPVVDLERLCEAMQQIGDRASTSVLLAQHPIRDRIFTLHELLVQSVTARYTAVNVVDTIRTFCENSHNNSTNLSAPHIEGVCNEYPYLYQPMFKEMKDVIKRGYTSKTSAKAPAAAAPAVATAPKPSIATGVTVQTVESKQGIADALRRASFASGLFYKFCVDNHIPLPFFVRTWRPHKTYNMGSMIRMISGPNGAANTLYKCPDFMMAQNASQKMIYGHLTTYIKTVVFFPERICIGQNVYCGASNEAESGYVGGNGVNVWDPLSEHHLRQYQSANLIRDMFVTIGPMAKAEAHTTWLSMSGKMPSTLNVSSEVNDLMWYEGSNAWSSYWNWNPEAINYLENKKYSAVQQARSETRRFNVICMQEVQLQFDPATRRWDKVTTDKGHWGENVYPGCGKIRCGASGSTFSVPNYIQQRVMGLV